MEVFRGILILNWTNIQTYFIYIYSCGKYLSIESDLFVFFFHNKKVEIHSNHGVFEYNNYSHNAKKHSSMISNE